MSDEPPKIDDPVSLGDWLRLETANRLDLMQIGFEDSQVKDNFAQAREENYLDKNIAAFDDVMAADDIPDDAAIGVAEANAFLASFQAQHTLRTRSRIQKWSQAYTVEHLDSTDDGLIENQLKHVGSIVDSFFITELLRVNPEGETEARRQELLRALTGVE